MKNKQKSRMIKKLKRIAAIPVLSAAIAMPATNANAGSNDDMYKVAGANLVINGLIAGIGSKIHGKGFWNGFKKGSMAGSLMYAGKYAMYNGEDKVGIPLLGKAVHALGTSIRDNTYYGEDPLSRYEIDVGPISIRYDKKDKDFSYKFLPGSIVGIGYGFSKGKLDVEDSLNTGNFVFHTENDEPLFDNYRGATIGNTIILNNKGKETSLGHELVHTGQDRELGIFDRMFSNRLDDKENWFASLEDKVEIGRGLAEIVANGYNMNDYEASPIELEASKGYKKSK